MLKNHLVLLRAAIFTSGSLSTALVHGQSEETQLQSPATQSPATQSPATQCVESHEQAQVHRIDGRLLESKASLLACASDHCSSFVRSDCLRWLEEVQAEIPTVIFEAVGDTGTLTEVVVSHNESELARRLHGRSHELNPGSYELMFSLHSGETKTVSVFVRQGEKNKLVTADFRSPPSTQPAGTSPAEQPPIAPSAPLHRPVPTAVYVAGGVAALATAGFIGLGVTTKVKERSAMNTCAPNCSNAVVNDIKTFALAADLSLGIAAASAITGAILYLTRPTVVESPPQAGTLWPAVTPAPGGAGLGLSGVF